jgi:hypothetical protein
LEFLTKFFEHKGVQIARSSDKNSKNRGTSQENQAQTQAQGGNGSWILQESQKSVGLIQSNKTLDLTVPRQGNTQLWCTRARGIDGLVYKQNKEENHTSLNRFSL